MTRLYFEEADFSASTHECRLFMSEEAKVAHGERERRRKSETIHGLGFTVHYALWFLCVS